MIDKRIFIRRIAAVIVGFACFCCCIINSSKIPDGYGLIFLFPIIYTIGLAASVRYMYTTDYKVTLVMYFVIQGIRFLAIPVLIALSGGNVGSEYVYVSDSSLETACMLMIVEFVVCTFFIIVWTSKKIRKKRILSPELTDNWMIYIPYVFFAATVYFVFGRENNIISFLLLSADTGARKGDLTDTKLLFVRQIVLIGIIVLFLWVLSYCKRKYDATRKNKYVYIAIFAAIINVCVIVGERRTTQIYTAFSCIYCLCQAFPNKRKRIVRYVAGAAAVVLIMMSIYKVSHVFLYSSYTEALASTNLSIEDLAITVQSYFNGPQNVAIAVEMAKTQSFGPMNFLYDIMRSTVPFNFFVKDIGTLVSNSFNNFIYNGETASGHLLSSVADGYLCFTPFFCYIVMLLNIRLAMLCERNMKKASSFEMIYVWSYILMRFAYGLSLNLPGLMNAASIMFITGGLLFKVARTFTLKGKKHM